MQFENLTNTLNNAQGRTVSAQDTIRQLWRDGSGQNFSELVLGDLMENVKLMESNSSEAAIQQKKNVQTRDEVRDYIAEVQGRDGTQKASNEQIKSQASQLKTQADALDAQRSQFDQKLCEVQRKLNSLDGEYTPLKQFPWV